MFNKYLLFFIYFGVFRLSSCPDNDIIKTESFIPKIQSVNFLSNTQLEITWESPEDQEIVGLLLSRKVGEEEWDDNYHELPIELNYYIDSLNIVSNIIISYRL
ncbi:MAG: hypothetical protein JXR87_07545, partial [Candidatus Marinimicrobia bacterium]|nr:hypothetical protein [Candidatus Neomarinimicrobiota bacterium]